MRIGFFGEFIWGGRGGPASVYKKNAKGTQIEVTDKYEPLSFRHSDGTETIVRINRTAKIALMLTYHDYTYVKKAAPRFSVYSGEQLTLAGIEARGYWLHLQGKWKEDKLLKNKPDLLKIYQEERDKKFPKEKVEEISKDKSASSQAFQSMPPISLFGNI